MNTPINFIRFSLAIALLTAGLTGCNNTQTPAQDVANPDTSNGDPAAGNLAPSGQSADQTQPVSAPNPQDYDENYNSQTGSASYDQSAEASQPPPPLPDYNQPPVPGDNYIWTPGYWSYSGGGYYWVPGAWVLAPWVGALWTPPWWGYDDGHYRWHSGYWGPHIGYYGGVNYGFGYTGRGYYGAYWNHGALDYNRVVTNVNGATVHNVYNYPVPNNSGNRVSYNGGHGGINARPTSQELAVARDPRTPPVATQVQHAREAATNRAQLATAGRPQPAALVATRPLSTPYRAPAARPPAAAMRAASPSAPQMHARPNEAPAPQAARAPESRSVAPPVQHAPAPESRTAGEQRPVQPPMQQRQARPEPPGRPETRPATPARTAPEARPEPRPAAPPRSAPQARPEPRHAAPPHPAPPPKEERKKT